MTATLAAIAAVLLVATLLPLSKSEAWWVRGLDFPRLQLALLAIVALVTGAVLLDLTRPESWAILAALAGCLVFHSWWIVPYTRVYPNEVATADGHDRERRLRILAVNVLTPNRNAPALLKHIREREPDVLVAVETDAWWESQLAPIEADYPHSLKCPLDNLYGIHLYSRLPLADSRIQFLVDPEIPSIHTLVVLRSGDRVRLHCLHPTPPSPTENPESSERDAELIAVGKSAVRATLPVVVTGDLNDVAWSATTRLFRKISGLLDPRVGRGMFNTFHARYPFARWPLDHIFHSQHFHLVTMERLGSVGSDHFPILVELQLDPDVEENGAAPEADVEDREWAEEKTSDEPVDESEVHAPGESRVG